MNQATYAGLIAHLVTIMTLTDCDGTLAQSRRWLQVHGDTVDAALGWLAAKDGFCDCSVRKTFKGLTRSLDVFTLDVAEFEDLAAQGSRLVMFPVGGRAGLKRAA